MQIVYWNTEFVNPPEKVWRLMSRLHERHGGVDYWCINESTPELAKLLEKQGFSVFYKPSNNHRGIFGTMIATKHKRTLKKYRSYNLSTAENKGDTYHTPLLMAGVEFNAQQFIICTTHLTYFSWRGLLRRRRERPQLVKFLPKHRTIFGGDLNTIILPFAKWDVINAGFRARAKGKTWRWHRSKDRRPMPITLQLDHIFASRDLAARVETKILGQQSISDHYPILVRVT